MKGLNIATGVNKEFSLWNGDAVEVLLETQSHSYYQLAINPAGAMVDLDRKGGGRNRLPNQYHCKRSETPCLSWPPVAPAPREPLGRLTWPRPATKLGDVRLLLRVRGPGGHDKRYGPVNRRKGTP